MTQPADPAAGDSAGIAPVELGDGPRTDSGGITRTSRAEDTPRRPFATQVGQEIQDRARATVRGVEGATGAAYSLAQLTEEALAAHCRQLEELYHDGRPWPVPRHLRPGRR